MEGKGSFQCSVVMSLLRRLMYILKLIVYSAVFLVATHPAYCKHRPEVACCVDLALMR